MSRQQFCQGQIEMSYFGQSRNGLIAAGKEHPVCLVWRKPIRLLDFLSRIVNNIASSPPEAGAKMHRGRNAGVAQLVEHNLAKVGVAGSNPVARSRFRSRPWAVFCFLFQTNKYPGTQWISRVTPKGKRANVTDQKFPAFDARPEGIHSKYPFSDRRNPGGVPKW